MRVLGRILRYVILAILVLTIAINLLMLGNKFILGKDNPEFLGYMTAIVLTGSMEPHIAPGDLLVFKKQDSYGLNQVVIFTQENSLVTHRIVDIKEGEFITKGDANNTKDFYPVKPNQVLGLLVLRLPKLGFVIDFFKNPIGIFLVILFLLLWVQFSGRKGNKKVDRHEKNK